MTSRRRSVLRKRLKARIRRLLQGRLALHTLAALVDLSLRGIFRTQRRDPRSSAWADILERNDPAIVSFWHGQHLLAPFFRPKHLRFIALLSKNRDADVNALVVERMGIATVRGSGGRVPGKTVEKGGARALIALRRHLAAGTNVFMIADVSKATARDAGLGIVTLAKISGRPVIPTAAVTSRRHVVERAWDKTTIPLPFGRFAMIMGEPIYVPADADAEAMERKRREITAAIEAANREALRIVAEPLA